MNPLKGTLWIMGAALGLFLLWRGYVWNESRLDGERAKFKLEVQSKDSLIAVANVEKARLDSALAHQVPIYIEGRDRILRDPATTPQVRACYQEADKVISACQKARAADSVVIIRQDSLITVLRNPPPPRAARRLQAYGEVMYDVAHMAPVFRVGATARVIGPVSLSAAGDLSIPPAGESRVTMRALAGLRIHF